MTGIRKSFLVRDTLEVANNITTTGSLNAVSISVTGNSILNVATVSVGNISNLSSNVFIVNTITANTSNTINATTRNLSSNTITSNSANIVTVTSNSANIVTVTSNSITTNSLSSANATVNNLVVDNLTVLGNSSLAFEQGSTLRSYREFVETANVTGSFVLDLLNSNVFRLNLSGNTTLSLNNAPSNSLTTPITLIVNRTATNARVTFPANTVWSESIQPVQSTGIGQRDIFTLLVIDSGATIVGSYSFANIG